MIQNQVYSQPRAMTEEEKDRAGPSGVRYDLDDAFIDIDGKRYRVVDLFRLMVDKLGERQ